LSRVYWDTMLFIYWLEEHPRYASRVDEIYARMKTRQDQLLTGSFTFGEVLAGFYRKGLSDRARETRRQLQELVSEVVDYTVETADRYGQIRASLALAPADAIHLASAAQAGTDLFLTNDKRLVGKFVPGIQFVASFEDDVL
jgi:predicted nucleic acid-binding protein